METTPILVPSKGRAGKSKLLDHLNTFRPNGGVYVFVEPQEIHTYAFNYPNLEVVDIMTTNKGITHVRNLIRRFAEDYSFEKYWMMDDDVSGFYLRDGTKMIATSMDIVLQAAEASFVAKGAALGGLDYQQLAWSATKDANENSFCDVAVWCDVAQLMGMRYDPVVEGKEDRDFAMQVVAAGLKTMRTTLQAFAAPKNGSNAGGLKELFYDQSGREEACVDAMLKKWGGGVITKIVKPDGRIDAKINWKAIKSGQKSVFDMFNMEGE